MFSCNLLHKSQWMREIECDKRVKVKETTACKKEWNCTNVTRYKMLVQIHLELHENEKIKSVRRGLRGNRVRALESLERISRRKARRNWTKTERQFERHTKQVKTAPNRSTIKIASQLSFKQPRANFHTILAMVCHILNNSLFWIFFVVTCLKSKLKQGFPWRSSVLPSGKIHAESSG
jgi:hypothetical protein